ncbi:LysR substrate-binding domain-containing protein [Cedecea sp. P7760]|jgi:DNA-binding transcriptional LysR family regulator|uniref:LysR substrate-binding domain-containing protein n=1 Tax=Cedecea sp. P7760 TaxID=2726983 RepID=UPI0015A3D3D6|nr:LysR substrate-binding domain-containing protein [Cedecea sp. P7760]NWC61907.1 LysR family transcriptional regulator [Cedecea sp. P7760]
MTHLDLDVLRTFVTGITLGSFARAAERLGRSTSAVSAQLKKLEEQVGTPVVKKAGRGLALTPAGEIVLSYAKRLLELNDAAMAAIVGTPLSGHVRVGFQEDFGEGILTEILGSFSRAHPAVMVEARIARNAELESAVGHSQLDMALFWQTPSAPVENEIGKIPLHWIGSAARMEDCIVQGEPLPLVTFDTPCILRSRAIEALDAAGLPWRIAFTSSSLNGLWAAARAGLGVTPRTLVGKPADLTTLRSLPSLPPLGICLQRSSPAPNPVLDFLATIIEEQVVAFCR